MQEDGQLLICGQTESLRGDRVVIEDEPPVDLPDRMKGGGEDLM
jgi:hypothetical protein